MRRRSTPVVTGRGTARAFLAREWHTFALTVGVSLLVPLFVLAAVRPDERALGTLAAPASGDSDVAFRAAREAAQVPSTRSARPRPAARPAQRRDAQPALRPGRRTVALVGVAAPPRPVSISSSPVRSQRSAPARTSTAAPVLAPPAAAPRPRAGTAPTGRPAPTRPDGRAGAAARPDGRAGTAALLDPDPVGTEPSKPISPDSGASIPGAGQATGEPPAPVLGAAGVIDAEAGAASIPEPAPAPAGDGSDQPADDGSGAVASPEPLAAGEAPAQGDLPPDAVAPDAVAPDAGAPDPGHSGAQPAWGKPAGAGNGHHARGHVRDRAAGRPGSPGRSVKAPGHAGAQPPGAPADAGVSSATQTIIVVVAVRSSTVEAVAVAASLRTGP